MMNDYSFKSKRQGFWGAIRKSLFFAVVFFCIGIITKSGNDSIKHVLLTTGLISLIISVYLLFKSRFAIDEIKIIGENIIFIGHSFNRHWYKTFNIKNSTIEIVSRGNGRGNIDYYFKIFHGIDSVSVNSTFTWEYSVLLEFFNTYKKIKEEKIYTSEKKLLEIMFKKALGYSNLDIFIKGKK
ncbi:MAG: hypothetical protein JNL13_09985 [Chitinophagaceae bacterium]|nr:hypothetical protein [Chitinophagaceae bacterium]